MRSVSPNLFCLKSFTGQQYFYIFDRAYMATKKLYIIEEAEAYFVVREKHKMSFEVIEDKEYNNPSSGIMAD